MFPYLDFEERRNKNLPVVNSTFLAILSLLNNSLLMCCWLFTSNIFMSIIINIVFCFFQVYGAVKLFNVDNKMMHKIICGFNEK